MNWEEELKHRTAKFLKINKKAGSYFETHLDGSVESFKPYHDKYFIVVDKITINQDIDLIEKKIDSRIYGETLQPFRSLGTEGFHKAHIDITSKADPNTLVMRIRYLENGSHNHHPYELTLGLEQDLVQLIIENFKHPRQLDNISIEIPENIFYGKPSAHLGITLPYWKEQDVVETFDRDRKEKEFIATWIIKPINTVRIITYL